MIIFQGQGAHHAQLGYCVIVKIYSRYKVQFKNGESETVEDLFGLEQLDVESVSPLGPKRVDVVTPNEIVGRVSISELEPAALTEDQLAEMQKVIETYFEQRFSRTLVPIKLVPYQYTKRNSAEVGPRSSIKLETDMNNGLIITGGKCEHGVYIPTWHSYEDDSPYCSICHPYSIIAKKGEYKA